VPVTQTDEPHPGTVHVNEARDPRLRDYRHLTDAAARRSVDGSEGHGTFVVEGVLAVRQLLRSRYRVRSVLSTPARAGALAAELDAAGVVAGAGTFEHLVATREVLRGVTGFDVHRGVLAAADRAPLPPAAELLAAARRVVVLDGINDHENLGALFRNAAALGATALLLDDTAADPLYRRSIRVSAGWTMRLPYARGGSPGALPGLLHDHGLRSVALTPAPCAVPVDQAAAQGLLDDPVALLVGAEGPGLPESTLAACDARVRIPMAGGVDSLNVATAMAVVAAFAAARRGWS